MSSALDTIERLRRNGWAPVRWAHHPEAIKELIRDAGFRPRAKGCYTNCGKLILACRLSEYEPDLMYCEGVLHRGEIGVPHAWVLYCGEVVDLTVTDSGCWREEKLRLTPEQFAERCYAAGSFGPFADPEPNADVMAALNAALATRFQLNAKDWT